MTRPAICVLGGLASLAAAAIAVAGQHPARAHISSPPPGIARVWSERGPLTPEQVYFGPGSASTNPLDRLPRGPFTNPEKKTTGLSPKIRVRDAAGIHWTVKLGPEARSDVAAPRLAWALGFGAQEGYFVESGKINGITGTTDLGNARGWIDHDGGFSGGARFKRSDKHNGEIQDPAGRDINWDPAINPGVPAEQLSGLLIFDALVRNWDAYPVNFKILRHQTDSVAENWFIVSDMGASLADRKPHKFDLARYRQTGFVKEVTGDYVILDYDAPSPQPQRVHRKVPLAHARWFRNRLGILTDETIRAAFDAAYATPGLNAAYASGDSAQIASARERELNADTRREVEGFTKAVRSKVDEFMQKVPP